MCINPSCKDIFPNFTWPVPVSSSHHFLTKSSTQHSTSFSCSRLEIYEESTNPNEHVDNYRAVTIPTCIPLWNIDVVMCKVFSTSLKGSALTCFDHHKLETISFFNNFALLFKLQFALSQIYWDVCGRSVHRSTKKKWVSTKFCTKIYEILCGDSRLWRCSSYFNLPKRA